MESSLSALLLSTMIACTGAMALGYQLAVTNGSADTILAMLGVHTALPMIKGLVRRKGSVCHYSPPCCRGTVFRYCSVGSDNWLLDVLLGQGTVS